MSSVDNRGGAAVESPKVLVRCPFCAKLNRVDLSRAKDRPACGGCTKPLLLDRPITITGDDLDRIVSEADVPVVVDFYADWCAPCKIMAPILDDLARERIGKILVTKLDTDRSPGATARFGIRGIPTLIIFRDGREFLRQTGAVPRKTLEGLVERALSEQQSKV
jgi:thioredoxin 2